MTFVLLLLATALPAYISGSINGAIITSKMLFKKDIRDYGSGNAGGTNFYRVFGKHGVVLVFIIDFLKTAVPVMFGGWLFGIYSDMAISDVWVLSQIFDVSFFGYVFAGFFAMLGHCYPVFYAFRGGKGVLALGAVVIVLDWRLAVIAWSIFIVVIAVTRFVSIGAMLGVASYPVCMYIFDIGGIWELTVAIICLIMVVIRHESNIRRIIKGEEPRFSLKYGKDVPDSGRIDEKNSGGDGQ